MRRHRAAAPGCRPTGPDTLLRLQRAEHPTALSTPRVLGVDDLALRPGHDKDAEWLADLLQDGLLPDPTCG